MAQGVALPYVSEKFSDPNSRDLHDALTDLCTVYSKIKNPPSPEDLRIIFHHAVRSLVRDPDCLRFLDSDDRERLVKNDSGPVPFKTDLVGYPCSPLYAHIGNYLALIAMSGIDRLQRIIELAQPIPQMLRYWTPEQFRRRVELLLGIVGKRGMLDLLQMRKTVGSRNVFPFTREEIIESGKELHHRFAELTLAGRAVAKHAVRDSTKAWWGECTGTEEEKNARGQVLIERVLDEALWINIHGLPVSIVTLCYAPNHFLWVTLPTKSGRIEWPIRDY
ncbi:unnamed protein product [Schistocephalus solidus]|uniref:AbiJ_NTD3 domain-containing protein n=1 Tax=Schistocephalus solidus TaxID=70667 RepID=A0A183TMI8_SCHSO|nr:unnamed protein product [Schistocephalus solidus]